MADIPKNYTKLQSLTRRNQLSHVKKLNRLKNLAIDCEQSKNLRKATNNNTTCHNNKVCRRLSFQTNQNAAFMDECGEFKIQWLFCRLTFPRTILAGPLCLPTSAAKIFCTCTNSTLSEPARRLDSSKFFA